jgi:hypothetical protein
MRRRRGWYHSLDVAVDPRGQQDGDAAILHPHVITHNETRCACVHLQRGGVHNAHRRVLRRHRLRCKTLDGGALDAGGLGREATQSAAVNVHMTRLVAIVDILSHYLRLRASLTLTNGLPRVKEADRGSVGQGPDAKRIKIALLDVV